MRKTVRETKKELGISKTKSEMRYEFENRCMQWQWLKARLILMKDQVLKFLLLLGSFLMLLPRKLTLLLPRLTTMTHLEAERLCILLRTRLLAVAGRQRMRRTSTALVSSGPT